jgi:hypothetical protein
MTEAMYGGYLDTLGKRFSAAFSTIETVYSFDYGPEFEIALCIALRSALPQSYGVCRGYAVNGSWSTAGDDILIYEQLRFPTLGLREPAMYLRKDKIPIEAVYAYIEAKHSIHIEGDGDQSLRHATEQVIRVKKLCSEREQIPIAEIFPKVRIDGADVHVTVGPNRPNIRNPMFGAIMARRIFLKKGGPELTKPDEIDQAIQESSNLTRDPNSPDLFILGKDNIAIPVIHHAGVHPAYVSPFFLYDRGDFANLKVPDRAFSVGFCSIMSALDWITLGTMPWISIIKSSFPSAL